MGIPSQMQDYNDVIVANTQYPCKIQGMYMCNMQGTFWIDEC